MAVRNRGCLYCCTGLTATGSAVRRRHKLSDIDSKATREFDLRCLTSVEDMTGNEIVSESVNQAPFARSVPTTPARVHLNAVGQSRRAAHAKGIGAVHSVGLVHVIATQRQRLSDRVAKRAARRT